MINMIVFHSGNPAWVTCQRAIGVATAMKEKFGERLDLNIYTNVAKEAESYVLKASTTVFVNHECAPLDIATSKEKMEEFLWKF